MKKLLENIESDIGNLNASSIIDYGLEVIRTNEIRKNIAPYWKFVTLIQFAINYSMDSQFLRNASKIDCRRILDKITKIEDKYILGNFGFKDENTTRKTMSIFSNQQFWLYDKYSEYDIARQLILFVDLDTESNSFQEVFKRKFNISIVRFLEFSFLIDLSFKTEDELKYNGKINPDLLMLFCAISSETEKDSFIDLLTLGKKKSRKEDLKEILKLKSPILQPFDISHWVKKPFLHNRNEIRIISMSLFRETIKSFIYDSLKHEPLFQIKFSTSRFERYMEIGLKESKIQFENEGSLKKRISKESKVIDFLVDNKILVECKATELVPLPSVLPEDEKVYKSIKTTIAKAYTQFYEFGKLLNLEDLYGVIVTYKPMYLGDGIDLSKESMREFVKKLTTEDLRMLPLENIFVISIDEWDSLIQLVKHKNCTVYELLKSIKERHKRKRSHFKGHIDEIAQKSEIKVFDFIQKRYSKFYDSILNEETRQKIKKYSTEPNAKHQ